MDKKLTIIIPIYNEENYIDDCLNSVLENIKDSGFDDSQYEVIVVSDGTKDTAIDKILMYENKFKSFKLIKNDHKGAGAARNVGLNEANGKYVSFIDADDKLSDGFLKNSIHLLDNNKDLYIFGLKRIEGEKIEYWTVEDNEYGIHDFADEYIKNGHLLVYSNCNKLYKTKIIKNNNIKFDESLSFGEDRLFNYDYLKHTSSILTSKIIKHDYIKRSEFSQSNKHYDSYFNIILKLYKEKIKCFISLKKNATDDEVKDFASRNLIAEIDSTIERFKIHQNEEKENLEIINNLFYEKDDVMNDDIGIFIILGSNNCFYKVDKALELCKNKPYMNFIVSGGNLHKCKTMTEAEFMAKYLQDKGINKDKIFVENKAKNTSENFTYSSQIVKDILKNNNKKNKIGIVTSDFHMKRTKYIAKEFFTEFYDDLYYFNALGPAVNKNTWNNSEFGKNILYTEIKKIIYYEFNKYLEFINSKTN